MNSMTDYSFAQKRAIIRVDFNVPLNENLAVTDASRIKAALPTIKLVLEKGGSVILMSHLGRPKNGPEDKFSLKHIVSTVEQELGTSVDFTNDCIGSEAVEKAQNLQSGQVLLLENLRFYNEEKEGNVDFAQKLANLADVYINDAFGTAHRAHASTAVIAEFFPNEKMFGLLLESELKQINNVMQSPEHPLTVIVGGAKVSSKLPVMLHLIDKLDNLIIGGGMAYTFALARGGSIGNSLVEEDMVDQALDLLKMAEEKGAKIYLPVDSKIANEFSNDAETDMAPIGEIPDGWMGLDIGPETEQLFADVIAASKTILWNGPVGVFEMSNFASGTSSVGKAVAKTTQEGAFSLIGGGDSVAAVNQLGLADSVSYISTGGGAMLELLEGKDLPGVTAILN